MDYRGSLPKGRHFSYPANPPSALLYALPQLHAFPPFFFWYQQLERIRDDCGWTWHTNQLILVGCYNSVVQHWQPDRETKNDEYYFQMNSQECIQLERLFFDLLHASLKPLSLFQKKQFWKQMAVNEKFMPAMPHSPKMSSLERSLLSTSVQLKGCLWSLHTVKYKYLPITYWELPHERKNIHSINSACMEFCMQTIKWLRKGS